MFVELFPHRSYLLFCSIEYSPVQQYCIMINPPQQEAEHPSQPNWEYKEASNYHQWTSILAAFPHLHQANQHLEHTVQQQHSYGIVIRSANDDNVHKAIKYAIWTTTPKNRVKIDQLWNRKELYNTNTYLFFSAVKSGMFEGVARLKSGYHEETFPFWWENHTLKFKGYFELEWIYIKDVNNKHFEGLTNLEGEEVSKSKDCDIVDGETTVKMLNIFDEKQPKRNIFMDFAYMDEREVNYVRKMYENNLQMNGYYAQQYQNYGYSQSNGYTNGYVQQAPNGYMPTVPNQLAQGMQASLNGYSSPVGHPLSFMSNITPLNAVNLTAQIPSSMVRPTTDLRQANNLGFQMNPVSKQKKQR